MEDVDLSLREGKIQLLRNLESSRHLREQVEHCGWIIQYGGRNAGTLQTKAITRQRGERDQFDWELKCASPLIPNGKVLFATNSRMTRIIGSLSEEYCGAHSKPGGRQSSA